MATTNKPYSDMTLNELLAANQQFMDKITHLKTHQRELQPYLDAELEADEASRRESAKNNPLTQTIGGNGNG